MTPNVNEQIAQLQAQINTLSQQVYKNNFTTLQDFPKYSRFKTRLQVPTLTTNPTIGAVGDLVCVGGKLKICTVASSTAPTWTIVGLQS